MKSITRINLKLRWRNTRGKYVDHCAFERHQWVCMRTVCTRCHPSSYSGFMCVRAQKHTTDCWLGPPSPSHNRSLSMSHRNRWKKESVPCVCVENPPWNLFEIYLMMWINKLWGSNENETMSPWSNRKKCWNAFVQFHCYTNPIIEPSSF